MNEIVDSIISLFYILKYGPIINGRRDFKKKLSFYEEFTGDEAEAYRSYVMKKINCLKVRPYVIGKPQYALFEKCRNTTRVFILNEEGQFMYRLDDYASVANNFYIKL